VFDTAPVSGGSQQNATIQPSRRLSAVLSRAPAMVSLEPTRYPRLDQPCTPACMQQQSRECRAPHSLPARGENQLFRRCWAVDNILVPVLRSPRSCMFNNDSQAAIPDRKIRNIGRCMQSRCLKSPICFGKDQMNQGLPRCYLSSSSSSFTDKDMLSHEARVEAPSQKTGRRTTNRNWQARKAGVRVKTVVPYL
jgi:hypothetical protein